MREDDDRTASLMTPARLAQLKERPRPAASPAAWLDQMAADAGSGHVRRLLELRGQLDGQLREAEGEAVAASGSALQQALDGLDFAPVQPRGWLARATGKGKDAAAGFAAQARRALRAAEDFADEVRAEQRKLPAQRAAVDRSLLEMDVELRAIEKIIDQASRWLQDMRNQLKARTAAGGDSDVQQQIQADAARCEVLVARLKLLRAASSGTQQAVEPARLAIERRAAWLAAAQAAAEGPVHGWQKALGALAEEVAGGGAAAADGLAQAREAQQALGPVLQRLAQEGEGARSQHAAALEQVAAAGAPLQAAA